MCSPLTIYKGINKLEPGKCIQKNAQGTSVPLAWYPRLKEASPTERDHWRLIGRGEGIHWMDIDEDISVQGLISGMPSGESQSFFKRWLESRQAG
ncbi:MAG: DUF2442 domain-containing protein [Desulfobacteraceae bacterium]